MSFAAALFYTLGAVAVLGAIGVVASLRNTVTSVISLLGSLVALSAISVLLEAHLVGAVQLLLHAGAGVVLFFFVVMLLGSERHELARGRRRVSRVAGCGVAILAAVALTRLVAPGLPEPAPLPAGFGGHRAIGIALYTDAVLAVALVSLVLLVALVGALVLSRRGAGS